MAFSNQTAVSDGTLAYLDLTIDYLDRSTIHVLFDNVEVDEGVEWQWSGSVEKRIEFINDPLANGLVVLVQRTSDISKVRHEFSKGAKFTAETLDEDLKQVLFIAQEASEGNLSADFFDDIRMHGNTVSQLRDAVAPDEAVPLGQFQPLFDAAYVESYNNMLLSMAWATQTSAPVDGTLYGAKYYADQAQTVLLNTVQTNMPNTYTADQTYSAGIYYNGVTADRALATTSTGFIGASSTTRTELSYVSGVTSPIQTQINSKASIAGGNTFSGTQVMPVLGLTSTTSASAASTGHALQIGLSTGLNMRFDPDSILFVNNGVLVEDLTASKIGQWDAKVSWPGVYTGSSVSNLAYPIGSPIFVYAGNTTARNGSDALYLAADDRYYSQTVSGTALTGTWRSRGLAGSGGSVAGMMFQRTA